MKVDKKKLNKYIYNALSKKINYFKSQNPDFNINDKKTWNKEVKDEYRYYYGIYYNALRLETKEHKTAFWINMFGKDNINAILDKYGLVLNDLNNIRAKNGGAYLIRWVLETFIIPELETTFNVTGIKLNKDLSFSKRNYLDLEDIEMIEKEK